MFNRTAAFVFILIVCAHLGANEIPDIIPTTTDLPPTVDLDVRAPDGLATVTALIAATEENLAEQRHLKELLLKYRRVEKEYLSDLDSGEKVSLLVETAHKTLQSIHANHLDALFEREFISELSLFSQIYQKNVEH